MKKTSNKKSRLILFATIVAILAVQFPNVQKAQASEKGAVSFTFDDGYTTTYTIAYPVLKERGFPATLYATTDWIGISNRKFLRWEQVRTLQNEGKWEIGNHTANHDRLWKKKFSSRYIQNDLERSQAAFVQNGIVEPVSFAPPYGKWNEKLMSAVRSLGFTSSRRAWIANDPLNDPENFNRWAIEVVSLKKPRTFKSVKKYIDRAARDKKWLVFVLHDMKNGKTKGSRYSVDELRKIADYVKELETNGSLEVLTVRDAVSRF